MNKQGKTDNTIWIVLAVAVVGYFLIFGLPGAKEAVPNDNIVPPNACGVEDVSFTPKMTREGKAGTSLTGASENYFILTDSLGSVNGGASTTVPTYYDMQVMFGEASTTYYTLVEDVEIDCQDPTYLAISLPLADQSLSTYVYNDDDQVNAVGEPQVFEADDEVELTLKIKASSNEYFGNPNSDCDNVLVVEYDRTYVKDVTGPATGTIPTAHSFYNSTMDGRKAFIIPKVGDGSDAEFSLTLESTSSDPVGSSPLYLTYYDCDIDKNEDDLSLISGIEDEDNNLLSLATANRFIYVS